MNESLMYGSEDQDGKRFPPLSSTTSVLDTGNAWGDLSSTAVGENLRQQDGSLSQESPSLKSGECQSQL
jgi:hypothetical protein